MNENRFRSWLTIHAVFFAAACGGARPASFGPSKVDIPVAETGKPARAKKADAPREAPPASLGTKESPFPAVHRSKLPNGLAVAVVTSHALPVVQVRVLVHAGSGYGAAPGVAELTAQMLKDGGTQALASAELLRRVESLGADLGVRTDADATVLAIAVTKDHLGEALDLLAQIVREPRFDDGELKKLKARETDEAEDSARGSGSFSASRIVFRELFPEHHPYATRGLVPSEIARVDVTQIREHWRRFFVPRNAEVVLAGDVDDAKLVAEHFGKWTGEAPPKIDFAPAHAPQKTHVIVAHRPKSVQSDVFVATLAPERSASDWPAVRVATQVLGGGVASRLFRDIREQRSLAYRTSAQIFELAHGDQPLVLYAGTETAKTTQAAAGLVENLGLMVSAHPQAAETETARRYLSDIFAVRMETIGSVADLVVAEDALGLPDGYWETYRKAVRAIEPAQVEAAAKELFGKSAVLVVVAGDADVVASDLTRFGDVTVVDPEKEMKPIRTVRKEDH
ncbi:MAG TPA: pitrilysin family protein [Labilithrix sp.]